MRNIAAQQRLEVRLAMDRTAEEFVHQLPTGRWFVGDFVAQREMARTSSWSRPSAADPSRS